VLPPVPTHPVRRNPTPPPDADYILFIERAIYFHHFDENNPLICIQIVFRILRVKRATY